MGDMEQAGSSAWAKYESARRNEARSADELFLDGFDAGWEAALASKAEPAGQIGFAQELLDALRRVVAEADRETDSFKAARAAIARAIEAPSAGTVPVRLDSERRKRAVREIASCINKLSLESTLDDTPDYVVADLMLDAALAYAQASVMKRLLTGAIAAVPEEREVRCRSERASPDEGPGTQVEARVEKDDG